MKTIFARTFVSAFSLSLAISVAGLTGCDSGQEASAVQGSEKTEKKDVDMAKVFGVQDAKAEERAKQKKIDAMEERMAEKRKAEAEAEWDTITVPAPGASAKLKAVCTELSKAMDTFMLSRLSGVSKDRWAATSSTDLNKVEKNCKAGKNVQVAACEINVFSNASRRIDDGDVAVIFSRCEEKFGKGKK